MAGHFDIYDLSDFIPFKTLGIFQKRDHQTPWAEILNNLKI